VLNELVCQHPLPGIILQHRKLSKLLDGFLKTLMHKVHEVARADACPEAAAAAGAGSSLLAAGGGPGSALLAVAGRAADSSSSSSGMGSAAARLVRIRGTFMQTNTSTGRLSMDDPSLQTIPRPVEYQLALSPGSQAGASAAAAAAGDDFSSSAGAGSPAAVMQQQLSNIRAAFVAPRGSVLMSADYCQIELRVMAHFSCDESLLAALTRPDVDPFVEMAASWLRLDKAQVGADCGVGGKARDNRVWLDIKLQYFRCCTYQLPGVYGAGTQMCNMGLTHSTLCCERHGVMCL
jgi:DNA polymerase theta